MIKNANAFAGVCLQSLRLRCSPRKQQLSSGTCKSALVTLEIWLLCFYAKSRNEPKTKQGRGIVGFISFHYTTGCNLAQATAPTADPTCPIQTLRYEHRTPSKPQPNGDTFQQNTLLPIWEEIQKKLLTLPCAGPDSLPTLAGAQLESSGLSPI